MRRNADRAGCRCRGRRWSGRFRRSPARARRSGRCRPATRRKCGSAGPCRGGRPGAPSASSAPHSHARRRGSSARRSAASRAQDSAANPAKWRHRRSRPSASSPGRHRPGSANSRASPARGASALPASLRRRAWRGLRRPVRRRCGWGRQAPGRRASGLPPATALQPCEDSAASTGILPCAARPRPPFRAVPPMPQLFKDTRCAALPFVPPLP